MTIDSHCERTPRTVRLAELTTIGLGGPATVYQATDADELVVLMQMLEPVDAPENMPAPLIFGGGSNLVISDEGTDRPVVQITHRGVSLAADSEDGGVVATIAAGENFDSVVKRLIDGGYYGLEALSGIPGSAGATPVQNVGAYGTEIADVLVSARIYDRHARRIRTVTPTELKLGYRSSTLRGTDQGIVIDLSVRLHRRAHEVRYSQLATALGCEVGDGVDPVDVRSAVLALRRSKGMVIDAADPDTRSCGSFFTNPIVDEKRLAMTNSRVAALFGADVQVPGFSAGPGQPGMTKLSAAWLIEKAGFCKGYPMVAGGAGDARPGSSVSVSTKHSLALTNRGGGSTAALVELAREIQAGVRATFGVELAPEPVLVGVDLS